MSVTARTCAAALLAAACCNAQALIITQQRQFAMGDATPWIVDFGQHQVAQSVALDFDRFDPGLGMLTAARWELQSELSVNVLADVHGDSRHPGAGQLNYGLSAYSSNAAGQPYLLGADTVLGGMLSDLRSCTAPVGASVCSIAIDDTLALDSTVAVSDLAALSGVGTFTQSLVATLNLSVLPDPLSGMLSRGSFLWVDSSARGGIGKLTLTYEYEPSGQSVPEPAPLALSTLGVLMMAMRRRRGVG